MYVYMCVYISMYISMYVFERSHPVVLYQYNSILVSL